MDFDGKKADQIVRELEGEMKALLADLRKAN